MKATQTINSGMDLKRKTEATVETNEEARESKLRSFLKALSWRLIATGTTFTLAYFVFKDTEGAMQKSTIVAAMELVLKLGLYYMHERGWQKLPSGSIRRIFNKQ